MSNSENTSPKGPKAIIEQAGEPAGLDANHVERGPEADAGTAESAADPFEKKGRVASGFQDATIGFFEGVGRAAWACADAHPHATLYGIIGFVLAVLILVIGLWDTIVIAAFSIVGVIIGKMVDDGSDTVRFLHRFDRRK